MAERKRMTSLLSKIGPAKSKELTTAPPEKKNNLFDRLNATSPLDAEPNLALIANQVSSFPSSEAASPSNGQTKWSDQMDRPNGQTKWIDQDMVRPNGQTKWSDQVDRPLGQTTWSDQVDRPNGQTTFPSPQKQLAKTRQQKAIFGYLAANPNIITSVNNLSEILSIPPSTIRKTLNLFEQANVIKKSRIGNNGLKILFMNEEWSDQVVRPSGQTIWSDHFHSKIDRRDKNLSISLERIQANWPHLARAGFGPAQMNQAVENLSALGKPTDRMVTGLDHAEWELEHGKMVDKTGQPVTDPCAWIFQSLSKTGYYRRPAGYVSMEEQAAKDAEAEARAVIAARQKAEQAQFEAWREGLSQEKLAKAMIGYPGGPKEAWLRSVWKRTLQNDG